MAACDFVAIPRNVKSGGSVRFVPVTTGFTKPVVSYAWDFGDTGTSSTPTPIHVYPAVSTLNSYTVSLTVTDSDGNTATISYTDAVTSDDVANVPAIPTDGSFRAVSVFLFSSVNSVLINRNPWGSGNTYGSIFYLLTPEITSSLDKIGTAKFSVLDTGQYIGTSYVDMQRDLLNEGVGVLIIQGKEVIFSGIIRRVTQNNQAGFSSTIKIKVFDIECDSDLARLKKESVSSSSLPTTGDTIIDSPANIFRRIMG
jgi:PKD repeat protein